MQIPLSTFEKKFLSLYFLIFSIIPLHATEMVFDRGIASINIEFANTLNLRKQGLMKRAKLNQDSGLLFIWPEKEQQCMWMKDTSIPLSLAFLKDDGMILEIFYLEPFSKSSVCSSNEVRFALEVNRGWFRENNVNIGSRLEMKTND